MYGAHLKALWPAAEHLLRCLDQIFFTLMHPHASAHFWCTFRILNRTAWSGHEGSRILLGSHVATVFLVRAHAKYCVVAVPLAQLALAPLPPTRALTAEGTVPPTLGLIDFSPPLGPDRRRALARYRMGCHNKVRTPVAFAVLYFLSSSSVLHGLRSSQRQRKLHRLISEASSLISVE